MKAVTYRRTGASDVLELGDREAREPHAGEVRVRIVVSGVNPTDWKSRVGSGTSTELPEPQVPNQDGSGIVDAVGPDVLTVAPGDRVWVWDAAWHRPDGTAQELAILPVDQVVPLPAIASFDAGAALGIPALTAHRALTAREGGPDRLARGALAGNTVLVAGGAGAVSHAAIQLAVWAGATVITTVSSDQKAALATSAGAHHVINYRTEDLKARMSQLAPSGADIIVEVNPVANIAHDMDIAAAGATISIYVGTDGEALPVPVRSAMAKNVRLQFILTYTTTASQKADAVAGVSAALADGALPVGDDAGLPITRFRLDQTAAAHDAVEHDAVGKVLIDVTPA